MELDFVHIECEIIAETHAQLTAALYNMLRDFEAYFKSSCCLTRQETCTSCSRYIGCPYQVVFAQQLSPDPEIVRLHQKPSLPFSLYISNIDSNISTATIGMVVIGTAVNYIEFFHTALSRMVEAVAYTVLHPAKFTMRCYNLDYQAARHEIRDSASLCESVILLSGQHILNNTVHSDCVTLWLKSPLRLLSNGSIAHRFDFAAFFRSQLRRCSSLCAYYGAGELDLDFVWLSEAAQSVAVMNDEIHYSQPSWSKRLNRAGLTGTAEFAGLVEPMFSLLRLGSFFNAGKGASFGSGFHIVEGL